MSNNGGNGQSLSGDRVSPRLAYRREVRQELRTAQWLLWRQGGFILSNNIGLDKITFFMGSGEFQVAPEFPARVEFPINAATGEALDNRAIYHDTDGRAVTGRVASLNTDNYQVTLRADRGGRGSMCLVQFSAGAFSDTNLEPLGRDEIVEKTKAVQDDLLSKGLRAHLMEARLSRLDVVRNVQMEEPVGCYAPAMAALGAKRRTRKMDFGGTGFIVGNKQWEVSLYDKEQEMVAKGYPPRSCPENTLRPELRLLKLRTLGTSSFLSVNDVYRDFGELRQIYRARMERDVFRAQIERKKEVPFDWDDLLAFTRESGTKRPWQQFKSEALLQFIVSQMGVEMATHKLTTGLGFDPDTESGKRQIRRVNDELVQAQFSLRMQEAPKEGHQVRKLYDELKRKVLN